jgi:predicted DNA-binding protein YlxM (UPF0122 family)
MFEKNLRLAYLLDFYGDTLDEHSRGIMRSYYEDDLSLAEIALGVGISRQGVRHVLKKSEEALEFLEEKLGLAEQSKNIELAVSELHSISLSMKESGNDEMIAKAMAIDSAIAKINNRSV